MLAQVGSAQQEAALLQTAEETSRAVEEALGQHLRAVARVYALCESGCSCCGVC